MIASLNGKVIALRKQSILLEVNGIGFEVLISNPEHYKLHQDIFMYTYMQTREDGMSLFGFDKEEEYELFCSLIKIKGIGPKTAIGMFKALSADEMLLAIENGDVKVLKSLPGIGAKTASQMILDLKGKVVLPAQDVRKPVIDNPAWQQTKEALLALGYKSFQLADLEEEMADKTGWSTDEMLRKSLQRLALRNGV